MAQMGLKKSGFLGPFTERISIVFTIFMFASMKRKFGVDFNFFCYFSEQNFENSSFQKRFYIFEIITPTETPTSKAPKKAPTAAPATGPISKPVFSYVRL